MPRVFPVVPASLSAEESKARATTAPFQPAPNGVGETALNLIFGMLCGLRKMRAKKDHD
jgi:hypothetical protein